MHILWLVIGLCGAVWIFWDNRTHGNPLGSSIRWSIGAFLAPIAVIPFYLLLSTLKQKYKSFYRKDTTTPEDVTSCMSVRCYHCKKFFQGNPGNCPHCGVTLKE